LARKSSNKYLTMPVMAFVHLKKGKKKPEVEVLSLKKGKLVLERNGRPIRSNLIHKDLLEHFVNRTSNTL